MRVSLRRISTDFFELVQPVKTQTLLFNKLELAQQARLNDQRCEGPTEQHCFVTKADIKHVRQAARRRAKFMEKERRLRMKMEAAAAKKERAKGKNKRRQHPAPTDVRGCGLSSCCLWEPCVVQPISFSWRDSPSSPRNSGKAHRVCGCCRR